MINPELREHLIETLRRAACDGECGDAEQDCQLTRVQPEVWEHGILVDVSGRVEVLVDVLLKELAPHLTDDTDLTEADIDRMTEQAAAESYHRVITVPPNTTLKERLEAGAPAELRCAAVIMGHRHDWHEWQPQPGMPVMRCPGRILCPLCGLDITEYDPDDVVGRTGDVRPYCSDECVTLAERSGLPLH